MSTSERIVLVAPNAGEGMGGEAIKALQYFRHLLEAGTDVTLIAHARSRPRLGDLAASPRVIFVEDGPVQRLLWRSRALAGLLGVVFHLAARRLIARRFDPETCLIHYLCPISPVEPRFPPRGFAFVLGPLNGAVGYPPAFHNAEGRRASVERALAGLAQRLSALLLHEKGRARVVLVSGGARTEASVRLAGARPERIRHVVDSGVSERFFTPRIRHEGVNGRFVAIGRFVAYKGFDMVIEAVARASAEVSLDVIGDGVDRVCLADLVRRLGLEDRVRFLGWVSNDEFAQRGREYRGFVFPTLAEANGIVMQEAMAVGLPVVTLRWGGPATLADDAAAVFVEPTSRDAVIEALAREMTVLAMDPDRAERLAAAARDIAEQRFRWPAVAGAWTSAIEASGDAEK